MKTCYPIEIEFRDGVHLMTDIALDNGDIVQFMGSKYIEGYAEIRWMEFWKIVVSVNNTASIITL
jgi:hypothetical protein